VQRAVNVLLYSKRAVQFYRVILCDFLAVIDAVVVVVVRVSAVDSNVSC